MILYQHPTSILQYKGWYGEGEGCDPFPLISGSGVTASYIPAISAIANVQEILPNNQGNRSFFSAAPLAFLNQLTELKCGHAYEINIIPGTGIIDIPEFRDATSSNVTEYRLTDNFLPPTISPDNYSGTGNFIATNGTPVDVSTYINSPDSGISNDGTNDIDVKSVAGGIIVASDGSVIVIAPNSTATIPPGGTLFTGTLIDADNDGIPDVSGTSAGYTGGPFTPPSGPDVDVDTYITGADSGVTNTSG